MVFTVDNNEKSRKETALVKFAAIIRERIGSKLFILMYPGQTARKSIFCKPIVPVSIDYYE